MKTYKFRVLIIAIIMVFFAKWSFIYAADNNPKGYTCNVTLTPDKTSVKPGEDITYELKVSNINAGNGIIIADFYVSYDSQNFDCKVRSYDEDKWLINGALNGKYTMSTYGAQPTNEEQVIAKIIFTPKTGITNNTYQTQVTNISFTTIDDSIITLNDITQNIKVESKQEIDKNYSCNMSFIPNKTSVKPGEAMSYDLKVTNINAGNGLKKIELNAGNFDSTKFECTVSNYDENKWLLTNSEGNIVIVPKNSQAWKTDETLAKISYTPKSGVTANTYQVPITNIKATTDDNSIITLKDTSLNIKVDAEQVIDKNYTCNMTLTPDKTTVKPGEDITFDLKVSNINAGNGLNKIELFLGNYNSNLFDCKVSNYDENKWIITSTEGNIVITQKNSQAWTSDEILAKIIYTPKNDIVANTYQIPITNIIATTDDNTKLTMNDMNLSINVENSNQVPSGNNKPGESPNSNTDTNGETTKGTTGGESTVSNIEKVSENSNEDKKSKDIVLPYTGKVGIIATIVVIITLISVSSGFYIKYKQLNI